MQQKKDKNNLYDKQQIQCSKTHYKYINKKFNYLTFSGKKVKVYQNKNYYQNVFICDCGNKTIQQMSSVINGTVKSCGCKFSEMKMKFSCENYLIKNGTKFGHLTVTEFSGFNNKKQRMYLCNCDCGKTKNHIVRGSLLKNGNVQSCGCLYKISAQKLKKKIVIGQIYTQTYKVLRETDQRQCQSIVYQCINIKTGKLVKVRSGMLITDPIKIFANKIRKTASDGLKGKFKTDKTLIRVQELIGCSIISLKQKFDNLMTQQMKQKGFSTDHICPCSQAQNIQQLLKLQNHENLTPLTLSDNCSKKNNKTPEAEEMCRKLLGREWIQIKSNGKRPNIN